jgi:hypothetical protein
VILDLTGWLAPRENPDPPGCQALQEPKETQGWQVLEDQVRQETKVIEACLVHLDSLGSMDLKEALGFLGSLALKVRWELKVTMECQDCQELMVCRE